MFDLVALLINLPTMDSQREVLELLNASNCSFSIRLIALSRSISTDRLEVKVARRSVAGHHRHITNLRRIPKMNIPEMNALWQSSLLMDVLWLSESSGNTWKFQVGKLTNLRVWQFLSMRFELRSDLNASNKQIKASLWMRSAESHS